MKIFVFPVLVMALPLTAFDQTNSKCEDIAKLKSPGVTLEITRAASVPAGRATGARGGNGPMLPAHCRIDGIMDKRTGTDGKTYGIRFAVALPNNWTGQYLQMGGGGLNGSVAVLAKQIIENYYGKPVAHTQCLECPTDLEFLIHYRATDNMPRVQPTGAVND